MLLLRYVEGYNADIHPRCLEAKQRMQRLVSK
jgi:hypothetical protein